MLRVRNFLSLLFALIFFFSIGVIAQDSKQSAVKKVTIKGEVLDLACYVAGEKKGEAHKRCAEMCIKGGAPIGILTDDGKVYLCVENHQKSEPYEKLKEFAAQRVTVTGVLYQRGGLPGIVVEAVEVSK